VNLVGKFSHFLISHCIFRKTDYREQAFTRRQKLIKGKISSTSSVGNFTYLNDFTASGEFFALGEVREYENGTAIKAIKTFSL
jgi:hypothetical protein